MKRMLGFLSARPTGGEAVEGGPEGGGEWGVYINGGVRGYSDFGRVLGKREENCRGRVLEA
jgi:hypothetical protein